MAKLTIHLKDKLLLTLDIEKSKEYIAGRSKESDILLDDPVISRQHLKIYHKESAWVVETLSKHSKVYHKDEEANYFTLDSNDTFTVYNYKFNFIYEEEDTQSKEQIDNHVNQEVQIVENENNIVFDDDNLKHDSPDNSNFENNNEKTFVPEMASQDWSYGLPFLMLKSADGKTKTLRLEGDYWLAGREDNCDIVIDDVKASREHFEIFKKQSQFFITDNSSNGTYLNNKKLLSKKDVPLRSGDTLQVGKVLMFFELRDPLFDEKMTRLPVEVQNTQLPQEVYSHSPNYEQKVIRLPNSSNQNNRKALMVGVVFVIMAAIYISNEEEQQTQNLSSKTQTKNINASPIDQLTPEQKDLVEKSYALAKNMYTQGKYELAQSEITKVHQLVPQYKDSKEIAQFSKNAIDTLFDQKEIERQEEAQRLQARKIIDIVNRCEKSYLSNNNSTELESCLEPALELDPENAKSKMLFEMVERNENAKEAQSERQAALRRKIKIRKNLFSKAKSLQKQGKVLDAIESYNRHIASVLPDPDNLETQSKKEVQNLKAKLSQDVKALSDEAEEAYSKKDYKTAIKKLISAIKLNPQDQNLKPKYDTYSKELYKIVKALYSDSVLEENLGNIDAAKEKWKKITEIDVEFGDYYKKASSKIRKYNL